MYRPRPIIANQLLTASAVTYYTAPDNTYVIVEAPSVCNTDTDAITVTIYLIPTGGSATAGTTIWSARSLSPGETMPIRELWGKVMNPGDFIQALASESTKIAFNASGILITQ